MKCRRCQGLMAEDQFFDFEGTYGFMWMRGWRCTELRSCGRSLERGQPPLARTLRGRMTMATILIIDDEETIRVLLRSALEAAGYEVTEAANGREGLELYRQRPTDLVITDIVMPELNGLDMLLELTREFLHAKVIAISGAGEEKNVLDVAKLLGARQTFQKPFSIPQLLNAVRYELEH